MQEMEAAFHRLAIHAKDVAETTAHLRPAHAVSHIRLFVAADVDMAWHEKSLQDETAGRRTGAPTPCLPLLALALLLSLAFVYQLADHMARSGKKPITVLALSIGGNSPPALHA